MTPRLIYLFLILMIIISIPAFAAQTDSMETVLQIGHSSRVSAIAFHPDGIHMASAAGRSIKIWNRNTGLEIRTLSGHRGMIHQIEFNPDGTRLLTASSGGTTRIWDTLTGETLLVLEVPGILLQTARFLSKGEKVVTGGTDGVLRVWDAVKGTRLEAIKAHDGTIRTLEVSKDGTTLITAGTDPEAKIWNTQTMELLHTLSASEGDEIIAAALSDDGSLAAIGGEHMMVSVYSLIERRFKFYLSEHYWEICSLSFSPDSSLLAATMASRSTNLWDMRTGEAAGTIGPEISDSDGGAIYAWQFLFDPFTGKFATGNEFESIEFWDVHTKELSSAMGADERFLKSAGQGIAEAELLPDLGGIVFRNDFQVQCWRFGPIRRTHIQGTRFRKPVCDFALLDGGARLFSVLSPYVQKCGLTALAKGAVVNEIDLTARVCAAAPGEDRVVIADGGKAFLYDLTTQTKIMEFAGHTDRILSVAVSPDQRFLLTTSVDTTARLWNLATGESLLTLSHHTGPVFSGAFAPKGDRVVTASDDRTARIWNARTGEEKIALEGHDGEVLDARFSPDGTRVLTTAWDNTARVWNPDTGEELARLRPRGGMFQHAAFSRDGRFIIAGDSERTILLWDAESLKLRATLFLVDEKTWAVTTPEGFFDASPEAKRYIHFVKGLETFELDQFFETYYKPNLLSAILADFPDALPVSNAVTQLGDSPPPLVRIVTPEDGIELAEPSVNVIVKVSDRGGGIDEVKLLHNGKRVSSLTRGLKGVAEKTKDPSEKFTFRLTLVPGENAVTASAFSLGRIESQPHTIRVRFKGHGRIATSYILAVGINQYRNKQLTLNFARADAEAFVAALRTGSSDLVKEIRENTLYDKEATRDALLTTLDRIAEQAGPNDLFTFYYAGHGSAVEGLYYLVTTENVKLYDPGRLKANAVSVQTLAEKLQNIKALKQLIIMDACQSGAATEALAFRGAAEEKALAQLARAAGVHVLASAGTEQFASEFEELGHGVFTYVLLEALSGRADGAPEDGKITVNELKAYIDDQVPILTEKYNGEEQWPTVQSRGRDFPLTLTSDH